METPSPQSSPASGRGSEREDQLLIPAGEGANESLRELHINQPLAGLKIAVTRPREQAAELARRIEQAGGIPLLLPLLDIAPAADQAALCKQVSRLAQKEPLAASFEERPFDLAIFISPNAVQYGMEAIRATLSPSPSPASGRGVRDSAGEGKVLALPANLKIATVGQGSAKALREMGIADVIAPAERFDSEGLLALPELQNVAGWRVLIFRGDGGRELLGDTLRARGAAVEYAACYRRSKPQQDIAVLLDAAPDAITVTSSEALDYLWQMLGDVRRDSACSIPLFVPHRRIADLAQRQGWRQVRLTEAGDDGLLSALIAWSREGREQNERTNSATG